MPTVEVAYFLEGLLSVGVRRVWASQKAWECLLSGGVCRRDEKIIADSGREVSNQFNTVFDQPKYGALI